MLSFQQGGGSNQRWRPRPRKTHFFPLSSQRKQNGSAAREEPMPVGGPSAGCLWSGLGGPGGGRVQQGWQLLTGRGSCQSTPERKLILMPPKECGEPADPGGQLCWPPREEEEKLRRWGGDVVAGTEERAPSWGSWESGPLGPSPSLPSNSRLVASVTELVGPAAVSGRPRVPQTGRGSLAEGPRPLA